MPDSPNNYSIKRKRSFNDTLQDRKIQKLSSSLANDIARSLSVSMDDVDMSPPAALPSSTAYTKQDPMPALRRISLSGTLNPQHIFTLDQWLEQQARQRNIPLQEHKQAFHDKQKTLRYHLDQLQRPDQSFNTLRDTLSKVLQIADELSGDHSLPFIVKKSNYKITKKKFTYIYIRKSSQNGHSMRQRSTSWQAISSP